jgi:fatty-acyl-CoA synthase
MLDPSCTLLENFREMAAQKADGPAVTFLDAALKPRQYSFVELFTCAEQIAARLAARNLDPAPPVGILMESQEMQVLHYLAALHCGLTPALLTPPNRKLNREYYLRTTRAVFEYCQFGAVISDLPDLEPGPPLLEPCSLRETHPGTLPRSQTIADGVLLQFSSGTTGIKRGVLVTDRAVIDQLNAYSTVLSLSDDDTIISWLPLYHDMGFIACLNMALGCGVHVIMMQPLDWVAAPGMYLRAASEYRATLGWNPNFAYAFMADRVAENEIPFLELSSFRGLINCSEPVTADSQRRFIERFERCGLGNDVFWGCYAMAETTFALTHGTSSDPGYFDWKGPEDCIGNRRLPFVSTGRPIPGVELKVMLSDNHPASDRRVGELWVKSPFNFRSYYNNADATRAAFHDGWYRTGDLGYCSGGEYFVCARQKDMLIAGGINVYPQDLEDTVSTVAGVQPGRVSAFGIFDELLQTERIVILAESATTGSEMVDLIVTIRQRTLSAFQIGNFDVHVVAPGWLIKSSAGKMARSANRQKFLQMDADT